MFVCRALGGAAGFTQDITAWHTAWQYRILRGIVLSARQSGGIRISEDHSSAARPLRKAAWVKSLERKLQARARDRDRRAATMRKVRSTTVCHGDGAPRQCSMGDVQ